MTIFPKITERPIIGVVVVFDENEKLGKYGLPTAYVKNIEASGARVVPIFPNESEEHYRKMFHKLNGLFVPGGYGAPLDEQKAVTEMVKIFYNLSIESFNNKENPIYWPIWGTCLGFEIIASIAAGMVDCLDSCQLCYGSRTVSFKEGYEESRLIKALSKDLLKAMSAVPMLPHLHSFCLTTKRLSDFNLDKTFRVIGTNKDTTGLEYVSIMEGLAYPIYAIMSHQEYTMFRLVKPEKYNLSRSAVRLGQELMNFFVDECCKNNNHFDSFEEENANLIQNYKPTFTAALVNLIEDYDGESYYFK